MRNMQKKSAALPLLQTAPQTQVGSLSESARLQPQEASKKQISRKKGAFAFPGSIYTFGAKNNISTASPSPTVRQTPSSGTENYTSSESTSLPAALPHCISVSTSDTKHPAKSAEKRPTQKFYPSKATLSQLLTRQIEIEEKYQNALIPGQLRTFISKTFPNEAIKTSLPRDKFLIRISHQLFTNNQKKIDSLLSERSVSQSQFNVIARSLIGIKKCEKCLKELETRGFGRDLLSKKETVTEYRKKVCNYIEETMKKVRRVNELLQLQQNYDANAAQALLMVSQFKKVIKDKKEVRDGVKITPHKLSGKRGLAN